MAKDYIKEIIDNLDFILMNFQINFNKEQRTQWSQLKLLYESKKKEILKENDIIKKALEDNKEMIEKEKGKNEK